MAASRRRRAKRSDEEMLDQARIARDHAQARVRQVERQLAGEMTGKERTHYLCRTMGLIVQHAGRYLTDEEVLTLADIAHVLCAMGPDDLNGIAGEGAWEHARDGVLRAARLGAAHWRLAGAGDAARVMASVTTQGASALEATGPREVDRLPDGRPYDGRPWWQDDVLTTVADDAIF